MRALVTAVAALLLWAGLLSDVSAKQHKRTAKRPAPYASPYDGREYPDANGWYPHDASKLRFGSAIWWDQMMREGRLKRN